ncbi:hypothetical protein J4Q44_G00271290 [Coregonus suidteri]|uniref:ABC transmembrane type-1 domain-containing protein n=1 Tax=Coregonus suidteri TaxID=861788 RepID=A0AAN8L6U8_9TELE
MREHTGNYMRDEGTCSAVAGLQGYSILLSRVGERVAADMRKTLFQSLLRQDVAFFDANKTGMLVNRLNVQVFLQTGRLSGALIGSFLRRLSRLAQEQVSKATGVADEALGNVRTVKAFAIEELYAWMRDE